MKGFKSCCVSNVVDGTDDAMLWNVRSECEENYSISVDHNSMAAHLTRGDYEGF